MFKLKLLVKYVGLGQSQSVLLLKGKSSSSVVWFPNPLAHDIQIHVSRGTRLKPWYSSVWCKSLRISWSFWSSGGVFPIISHLSDVYGIWLPYMQDERNLIIKRQLVWLTVSHKPEAVVLRSTRVLVKAKIVSEDNPSLDIEKMGLGRL